MQQNTTSNAVGRAPPWRVKATIQYAARMKARQQSGIADHQAGRQIERYIGMALQAEQQNSSRQKMKKNLIHHHHAETQNEHNGHDGHGANDDS